MLDEPTSSVDPESDATIQRMVREDFADALSLTIAHRLNTIIDCGVILVMDAAKKAEFGTPAELLAANGLFAAMCAEADVQA